MIPSKARFLPRVCRSHVVLRVLFQNATLDYRSAIGYIAFYRHFLLRLPSNSDLELAMWPLFWLNMIYSCTTKFASPLMLTFLGYRCYLSIACRDNGKVEFLFSEKVILTILLFGLIFLAKIYLVVSPRRLSTGLRSEL